MRQHPASTLFPYTTLFRSPSTSLGARSAAPVAGAQAGDPLLGRRVGAPEVGEVHAPPRQRVDDERAGVGRVDVHRDLAGTDLQLLQGPGERLEIGRAHV